MYSVEYFLKQTFYTQSLIVTFKIAVMFDDKNSAFCVAFQLLLTLLSYSLYCMSAFSEINLLNTVLDSNVQNSCISSSKDNSFCIAFKLLLTLFS